MSIALRNSIFNNVTYSNGFSYIHIPLIYKTTHLLILQMYADAIKILFKITNLNKNFYYRIIDKLVIEFSTNETNNLHLYLINILNDKSFLNKVQKQLKKNSKKMPSLFEIWENNISNNKKTSKKIFKKIYDIIVFSLAINYLSFVIETFLPQYILSNKGNEYNNFLENNSFSHIKYFLEEKNKQKDTLLTFARNIGFLANEIGEPTQYEDINFLRENSNKLKNINEIFSGNFYFPYINFDKEVNITEKFPPIISAAKIMQNNLEFRHYWQLRLSRNLRLQTNNNKTIIQTWLYKDYETNLFNI